MSIGLSMTMADGRVLTSSLFGLPRVLVSQLVPPKSSLVIPGFDITRGLLSLDPAPGATQFIYENAFIAWNASTSTASWTADWAPPGQYILTAIVF